jgi:hypothetical protein
MSQADLRDILMILDWLSASKTKPQFTIEPAFDRLRERVKQAAPQSEQEAPRQ